jgi:hypothetical protein
VADKTDEPLAINIFLSEQISHQPAASSTFLSKKMSISDGTQNYGYPNTVITNNYHNHNGPWVFLAAYENYFYEGKRPQVKLQHHVASNLQPPTS